MHLLYLPIDSKNLPNYFNYGIIEPHTHYSNIKWHNDSQSIFQEYLLLTNEPFTDKNDCSLQVVLTENEKNDLHPLDNISSWLLNKPIPLSRIDKIIFKNSDQLKDTCYNINQGAGIVTSDMCSMVTYPIDEIPESSLKCSSDLPSLPDLREQYASYDRILGGIAFVKMFIRRKNIQNAQFFTFLSLTNKIIKVRLENEIELDNAISKGWESIKKYKNIAEVKIDVPKSLLTTSREINFVKSIDQDFLLPAVIFSFGEGGVGVTKGTEDLINFCFSNNITDTKLLQIAYLYGRKLTYHGLNNSYSVNNERIDNVKFDLSEIWNKYIVETLFQFSFNKEVTDREFLISLTQDESSFIDGKINEYCFKKKSGESSQEFTTFFTKFLEEFELQKKLAKENLIRVQELFNAVNILKESQEQSMQYFNDYFKVLNRLKFEYEESLNKLKVEISSLRSERNQLQVENGNIKATKNKLIADLNERTSKISKSDSENEILRKKVHVSKNEDNLGENEVEISRDENNEIVQAINVESIYEQLNSGDVSDLKEVKNEETNVSYQEDSEVLNYKSESHDNNLKRGQSNNQPGDLTNLFSQENGIMDFNVDPLQRLTYNKPNDNDKVSEGRIKRVKKK